MQDLTESGTRHLPTKIIPPRLDSDSYNLTLSPFDQDHVAFPPSNRTPIHIPAYAHSRPDPGVTVCIGRILLLVLILIAINTNSY